MVAGIQFSITGCGAAWLARLIWDQEVAGSNPVTPSFIIWWVWHSWLARQIVALEVVGSNPTIHPFFCGSLAQLVEHWTFNPGVSGSSPE